MRLSPLVPLIATALLLILPAGIASAASPEGGTIVTVELDLKTSNGLRAHLATDDEETVTLEIGPRTNGVVYEVKGQVTEAGLKARFGRLGTIDVAFTPTRTLGSTEPSQGCSGSPRTWREGVFTGMIDFTGERNYVRLEGPQAAGSMSVISQWQCPEPEEPAPFAGVADPLARRFQRVEATLYAATRHCSCIFAAGVKRTRNWARSVFYGLRQESREGMKITRLTFVQSSPSHFVLGREGEQRTATLRPPKPFSGQATFETRRHAPGRWRGSIRIPFLGIKPSRLSGSTTGALLIPEYHFDNE